MPDLLAPLATAGDLTDRNITVPDAMLADSILAAASSAVRDAAGCPISQATSTVTLTTSDQAVTLPGRPVTGVTSVSVNGTAVDQSAFSNGYWSTSGWRLVDGALWLPWRRSIQPANVTVTYTHGLAVVPDDIVDLVCSMVGIAVAQSDNYGAQSRLLSVHLGDFTETYMQPPNGALSSPAPTALPESVRQALRARFGGSAAVL